MGTAVQSQDLWVLEEKGKTKGKGENYGAEAQSEERIWHLRFGHLGSENLKKLVSTLMVRGILPKGNFSGLNSVCEACMKGRQNREPFPIAEHRGRKLLELVHSDLANPGCCNSTLKLSVSISSPKRSLESSI